MSFNLKIAQEQLLLLFEQHLYILADPFMPDDLPSIKGDYIKTQMDFCGDINGQFIMLLPQNKLKEIMSNFLGLENDDPKINEMSNFDTAAEIINILGAHILSSWLDDQGLFKIGLPETSAFASNEQTDFLQDKNITGIFIDGEPVFLKIVFK